MSRTTSLEELEEKQAWQIFVKIGWDHNGEGKEIKWRQRCHNVGRIFSEYSALYNSLIQKDGA
jgi:hypothetical protein